MTLAQGSSTVQFVTKSFETSYRHPSTGRWRKGPTIIRTEVFVMVGDQRITLTTHEHRRQV